MSKDQQRRYITVQRQHAGGGWMDVGNILLPDGELPGGFRYADTYSGPPLSPDLDYRDRRTALDPRFFPIHTGGMLHTRPVDVNDLHGVFQEALPGRWGENVMVSYVPGYGRSSPAEKLWMLGDWMAGGLRYEVDGSGETLAIENMGALIALRLEVNGFVEQLARRVRPDALGMQTQRWALASNGGQTPKCAFVRDGTEYVAKFSMTHLGTIETTRIEHAMADISRAAHIDTARTELVETGDGDAIMLSQRFDVDDQGRRIHKINAATALGVPIGAQRDYTDMVAFIRKHSSDPEGDTRELFGRMLLNVFANNTDDHLGQFEFLADGDQWRLAPNFDVLVDELEPDGSRRPHALRIAGDALVPTLSADWIDEVADRFGLDADAGREIASRVAAAMERFPETMRAAGVNEETLQRYLLPAVSIEQLIELRESLQQRQAPAPAMM